MKIFPKKYFAVFIMLKPGDNETRKLMKTLKP